MPESPLVSVIIPTYNRPQYIRRAIDSCFSQKNVRVEVIVVDDNGLGTEAQVTVEEMLKVYNTNSNFKYVPHQVNKNGAAARNTGIRIASGKYIAFLDDDDWYEPLKIVAQINQMKDEETRACLCGFRRWYGEITVEGLPLYNDLPFMLLASKADTCAGSALILEKSLAEELGGFQENFLRRQDVEFLYRVSKKTKVSVVEDILVNVYMHSGNLHKTHQKDINGIIRFMDSFEEEINCYPRHKRAEILNANYLELAKLSLKDRDVKSTLKWLIKAPCSIKNSYLLVKSMSVYLKKKAIYQIVK